MANKVKQRQLIRDLTDAGFFLERSSKHNIYKHPDLPHLFVKLPKGKTSQLVYGSIMREATKYIEEAKNYMNQHSTMPESQTPKPEPNNIASPGNTQVDELIAQGREEQEPLTTFEIPRPWRSLKNGQFLAPIKKVLAVAGSPEKVEQEFREAYLACTLAELSTYFASPDYPTGLNTMDIQILKRIFSIENKNKPRVSKTFSAPNYLTEKARTPTIGVGKDVLTIHKPKAIINGAKETITSHPNVPVELDYDRLAQSLLRHLRPMIEEVVSENLWTPASVSQISVAVSQRIKPILEEVVPESFWSMAAKMWMAYQEQKDRKERNARLGS